MNSDPLRIRTWGRGKEGGACITIKVKHKFDMFTFMFNGLFPIIALWNSMLKNFWYHNVTIL